MSYEGLDDTATRVTKEFEEAVCLAQTSGRARREIAGALGIGAWVGLDFYSIIPGRVRC